MTPPVSPDPDPKQPKRRSAGRSRPRSRPKKTAPDDDELLLAALRAGLEEALPGLEIVDRDLVLDERGRADLAAVDASGRLVLVIVAAKNGDRTALDALDALAFARRNADVLARHLDPRIEPGLQPRVVVVDPSNAADLLERLTPLAPQGIEVFGVRTIKSAAGERSYLIAREAPGAIGGPGGVEAFLEALPESLRELGRGLAERMQRLDDELLATGDRNTVVWRLNGDVLARLERVGRHLQASVGPERRAGPIRDPADADRLLEGAMARLVECLERRGAVGTAAEAPADVPGAPEAPEGPGAPLEGDRERSRAPGDDEPLLTEEEIQAFRE